VIGRDLIEQRTESSVSEAWGTGTMYARYYPVAKGAAEALMASGGELALGSNMPTAWKDTAPGTAINSPKLQSVSRQQKGSGDVLVCQFLAIDLASAIADGYATTRSTNAVSSGHFEDVAETWGIASTVTSSGIPEPGDTLTGAGNRRMICMEPVEKIVGNLHGRVLVHARWMLLKDYTEIVYW